MNEINFKIENVEEITLNMDTAVKEITPPLINLEVTPNNEIQKFTHEGEYGYDEVIVNAVNLQKKEITPTKEEQIIKADADYSGLSQVKVSAIPDEYISPNGTLDITSNGNYDVANYKNANVNIGGDDGAGIIFSDYASGYPRKATINFSTTFIPQFLLSSNASSGSVSGHQYTLSLKEIVLNKIYTIINNSAFQSLNQLTNINLEEGLTTIKPSAFRSCSALALTSLPSTITIIDQYVFRDCIKLALKELPPNLTTLGSYAFYGCTNLALESLPSTLASIENQVFYNCKSLALKEIPNNILSIGQYAFNGCTGLTELTIKGNLTTIGNSAFYSCSNLAKVVLEGTTVPTGGTNMFSSTPIASGTGYIYVQDDLVGSYKTATYWSTYANQIKPISELEG